MARAFEQGHIFISYRREEPDNSFVVRLADNLKAAGHRIWMDVEGIEGAKSWTEQIQYAIDTCYAYVIILSPDSMASRWVRNELLYALNQKPNLVYPVMYRQVQLPVELVAIQFVDFRDEYDQALKRLLRDLPKPPEIRPPLPEELETARYSATSQIAESKRRSYNPLWIGAGLIAISAIIVAILIFMNILGGNGDAESTRQPMSAIATENQSESDMEVTATAVIEEDKPDPTQLFLEAQSTEEKAMLEETIAFLDSERLTSEAKPEIVEQPTIKPAPRTPTPGHTAGDPTPSPTTDLIAPAEDAPLLTAVQDINIRSGPDIEYGIVGVMLKGQTARTIAQTGFAEGRLYWKIECPKDVQATDCWVSGGDEYTRVERGSLVPTLQP